MTSSIDFAYLRSQLIDRYGTLREASRVHCVPYNHLCLVLNGHRDDFDLVQELSEVLLKPHKVDCMTDPERIRSEIKRKYKNVAGFCRKNPDIPYSRVLGLTQYATVADASDVKTLVSRLGLGDG